MIRLKLSESKTRQLFNSLLPAQRLLIDLAGYIRSMRSLIFTTHALIEELHVSFSHLRYIDGVSILRDNH